MDSIATTPNLYFINRYRHEIENELFRNDTEALVKAYNAVERSKLNADKLSEAQKAGILLELSKKSLSQGLINVYSNLLMQIGTGEMETTFVSDFSEPIAIDLKATAIPNVSLYDYQEKAITAMEHDFLIKNVQKGLLVLPTGSGKTRTAVCFLLDKMVSSGYQVVWLTHRHMLVDQPAECFRRYSGLVKRNAPSKKSLKITCVSGQHSSIRRTSKKDDILILSVQSAVRSLGFLKKALSGKVIIVVDEAHHAIAASYRKIIECISKKVKSAKLLGLTATPVRASEQGSHALMKLFNNNIIFIEKLSFLIKQGVLAVPEFENISTGYEVVADIDEQKYIKKYGEISPGLVDIIARSSQRNKVITEQYMQNRDKYGKTLIFALNVHHCVSLCEDFRKLNVKCDFVYSGKPGNDVVIKQFQYGDIDVLININILSEGSDVPDIQTVFLTRPTMSEVLLMQMIGRGLRGTASDGTEKVYIVDFNDNWSTFTKWLNPEFLMGGEADLPIESPVTPKNEAPKVFIPLSVIADIYNAITYDHLGHPIIGQTIPAGWFSYVDDEGNDITVLVTEDQLDGYKALAEIYSVLLENTSINASDLLQYFGDFVTTPSVEDLQLYLNDLRSDGSIPHIYPFTGRKQIDPVYVAEQIKCENPTFMEIDTMIEVIFNDNETAQNLYLDVESYKARVWDCLRYAGGHTPDGGKVSELSLEMLPFDRTPFHDIVSLFNEVVSEMFDGLWSGTTDVDWTKKAVSRYFGMYITDVLDERIRINKMLNSKDVPKEVIKYLLYHEMLHREYHYHDRFFREQEHKYLNWVDHDRFLDGELIKHDTLGQWIR